MLSSHQSSDDASAHETGEVMASMPAVDIHECGELNITVRVKGIQEFRFRFWMMRLLIRVASFVAPRNTKVELEHW